MQLCDFLLFLCHLGAHIPSLRVHPAVFSCVRKMARLPTPGIFNEYTGVNEPDCLWGLYKHLGFFNEYTGVNGLDCLWELYEHLKRVCTESKPSAKNPLLHQGVKPGTGPCQTDAQSIELHPCTAELN